MKYEVILQTREMKKKSKPVIVELPHNELPTPYNIICQRLYDYYSEHREELGLNTNIEIARASCYDAEEMIDNLLYYEIKEIK